MVADCVEDDRLVVTVVAVDKREEGVVYDAALERLSAVAQTLASAVRSRTKKSED